MSHHSSIPEMESDDDRARREQVASKLSEAMRKIFGEYPEGKLNLNDEGAIAIAIGEEKGRVVIRFPKPIAWIGFTPVQAMEIAESLIHNARKCGGPVPLVLRVGAAREEKP